MGLDFSHGDARWSYGGFHNFRSRLAVEAKIPSGSLEKMQGFGGIQSWDNWDDPIKPLLNHSDCDGELSPKQCSIIAPRLRELVKDWDNDDWDKVNALALADAMDSCSENKEHLIFC